MSSDDVVVISERAMDSFEKDRVYTTLAEVVNLRQAEVIDTQAAATRGFVAASKAAWQRLAAKREAAAAAAKAATISKHEMGRLFLSLRRGF